MRFAKILSVAALPMFLFACSDDNSSLKVNNPEGETPQDSSKVEPPPNIPDEDLKPIARDFSSIWSGNGTVEDPFLVTNEEQLASIAFYVNDSSMTFKDKFFKVTADIALTKAWSPIGIFGKNPNGLGNRVFSGSFDGASKTISGLTINDTAAYTGLFGLVRGARISNVVIKDAKVNVGSVAGVLAGLADSVTVENCTIDNAEIKGTEHVGGLVGEAKYVTVTNIAVTGSVSGTNNVGGAMGSVQNGTLTNLTNSATVTGKSTVGGVVGGSSSVGDESSISMALNYGAVSGTRDVGGVAAKISTTKMERVGNYGALTADESSMSNVGGVVGVASNKSVINEVFNAGTITITKVMAAGGVIGSLKAVTATNVFNQGEISGQASNLGGLVGIVDNDAKLESGYNSAKVPDNNLSGMVAGKVASTATFVATLNGAGAVWAIDPAKFGGYPSFSWAK